MYHALFETQGLDTAKVLVAGGADVNVTLRDNKSLLHEACYKGDTVVAEFLLSQKIDVHRKERSTGRNALHVLASIKEGDKTGQLIGLILKQGGRVDEQSDGTDGFTALHEAASNGNTKAVQALLDGGADTEIKDGMLKRTALVLASRKDHGDIVEILKKAAAKRSGK